jgi:branched-chain amino acid transport system substrate-binding protein
MTGNQTKQGKDIKNGVELAVSEWNEKGGVLGKKIELMVGDDQQDPKQAAAVAHKMVFSKVVGVVGHYDSSSTMSALEIYHREEIPMITPASTNPQITEKGYTNVFRVVGRDDQQGKVSAEFILTQLKAKKVAILHDKTTYGQGLAEEFQKALGNHVEVVYEGGIIKGDKDFRGVLTTVASKKPEVYFFGGYYTEAGLIARQAKEVGLSVPMLTGDAVIDPVFIDIAGDAAEGTYLTYSADVTKLPSVQEILKKYRERYGEPGPYSIYAYDAAQVLLNGIQRAETTHGFGISQAIHTSSTQGITGNLQFDLKGDLVFTQYIVWVTENGEFKEFWKPGGN